MNAGDARGTGRVRIPIADVDDGEDETCVVDVEKCFQGTVEEALVSIRTGDANVLGAVMLLGRKLNGRIELGVDDMVQLIGMCDSEAPLGNECRVLLRKVIELHPHTAEVLAEHDITLIWKLMKMKFEKEMVKLLNVIFRSSPKIGEAMPGEFFLEWVRSLAELGQDHDNMLYRLVTVRKLAMMYSESRFMIDMIGILCANLISALADCEKDIFTVILEIVAVFVTYENEDRVLEWAVQFNEKGGFQTLFSRFSPRDTDTGRLILLVLVQLSAQKFETSAILMQSNIEQFVTTNYPLLTDETLKRHMIEILRNCFARHPESQLHFLDSSLPPVIFANLDQCGFRLKKAIIYFLTTFPASSDKFIQFFTTFNLIDTFGEVFQDTSSDKLRHDILCCLLSLSRVFIRGGNRELAQSFFTKLATFYDTVTQIEDESENEELLAKIAIYHSIMEEAENSELLL